METNRGIEVTDENLQEFFSDIRCGNIRNEVALTEFQKAVIVQAYEKGYHKGATAKKLNISDKKMRSYYDDYKRGKK